MKRSLLVIFLLASLTAFSQNPVQVSQPQWFLKYIKQGPYTTTTLPTPSTCVGCFVYNSDSLQFQFSNGATWRSIAGTNTAGGGVDTIFQHADSLLYRISGVVKYGGKWLTLTDTTNGIASTFALADSVSSRVKYGDSGTVYLTPYNASQLYYPLNSNPKGYYKATDTAFTLATQVTARRIADSVGALKVNISDTAAQGARNTLAYVVNNGNRAYKSLLVGNSLYGGDTLTFNGNGPVSITNAQDYTINTTNLRVNDYATYFTGAGGVNAPYYVSNYYGGYVFQGSVGVVNLKSVVPLTGTYYQTLQSKNADDTIADLSDVRSATVNAVSKIVVDTIVAQKYINPVLNYTADNQSLTAVTITPTIQLNGHTGNSYTALQVNGPTNVSTNLTVGTAISTQLLQANLKIITTNIQPYINGSIKSGTIGNGGTGYGSNVTYTNVSMSSTGGGTATFAGVTSNSSGVITSVTYSAPVGLGFSIGDTVRPVSALGSGTGFYYLVTNAQNGLYFNAQNGTQNAQMFNNGHWVFSGTTGTPLTDTTGGYVLTVRGKTLLRDTVNIQGLTSGTPAYSLNVDALGNVIRSSVAGGGTVTGLTATNNYAQTWTITNPSTTPNLSLVLDTSYSFSTKAYRQKGIDSLNALIVANTTAIAGKIGLSNLSASSPLAYNNSTGAFSIQQANTSQSGYLSSTDWNTFNSKGGTATLTLGRGLTGGSYNPNLADTAGLDTTLTYNWLAQQNIYSAIIGGNTPVGNALTNANVLKLVSNSTTGTFGLQNLNGKGYASYDFYDSAGNYALSTGYANINASLFPGLLYWNTIKDAIFAYGSTEWLRFNSSNNRLGLLTSAPTHTLTFGSSNTGTASYNTADQTTNYERVVSQWQSNVYTIGSYFGGTGGNRSIQIGVQTTAGNNTLASSRAITINSSALSNAGAIDFTIGGTGVTIGPQFTFQGIGNASSGTQSWVSIQPTFNQTSTANSTTLLISPYLQNAPGTNYLINAGISSAASGGGTFTQVFWLSNTGQGAFAGRLAVNGVNAVSAVLHMQNTPISTSGLFSINGLGIRQDAATYTSTTASGTIANNAVNSFAKPTLAANSATTLTNPATIYIDGAPIAGTNVTETNPWSLNVGSGNVRIGGNLNLTHIIGISSTPTIAAGAAAGTSPTISVSGTDMAGTITVTTGTSTTTGVIATVTFANNYGAAPTPVYTAANSAAIALTASTTPYYTTTTSTLVLNTGASALTASTTYKFYYHIIQ